MLRLGSPGKDQLDLLPGKVTGIPPSFHCHPFQYIDWKEEARVKKQAAGKSAEQTTEQGRRFYMDFGFMHASSADYSHQKIESLTLGMVTHCTYWWWRRLPGTPGYSSLNPRNHRLTL